MKGWAAVMATHNVGHAEELREIVADAQRRDDLILLTVNGIERRLQWTDIKRVKGPAGLEMCVNVQDVDDSTQYSLVLPYRYNAAGRAIVKSQ